MLEIFKRHALERTNLDLAGIVDQDVDRAEAKGYLLNGRLDLLAVRDVALNCQDASAAMQRGLRGF